MKSRNFTPRWIFILIIVGTVLFGLYQLSTATFEIIQKENFTPKVQESEESEVLFDSLVLFTPDQSELLVNLPMIRMWIYEIQFMCYVPYVTFELSLGLTSPAGLKYPVWNVTESPQLTYSSQSIQYLAAESGTHLTKFSIFTSNNLTLHLMIEKHESLGQYFVPKLLLPQEMLLYSLLDVMVYNDAQIRVIYAIPMQEGYIYKFEFIRGNPIAQTTVEQIGFTHPNINMTVTLGGIEFPLYQNIETCGVFDSKPQLNQIKFGAYTSGTATIEIKVDPRPVNMNFAFLVYAVTSIDPINNTESENRTEVDNPPIHEIPLIDQITAWINNIIQTQGEYILLIGGLVFVVGVGGAIMIKLRNRRFGGVA